nr:fasciclin domain-containing protein [uncultured Sphingomonas sp.]
MKMRPILTAMAVGSALMIQACGQSESATESKEAQAAAGDQTILAGLGDATKFAAATKEAGLDGTFSGPGPYTVLVPSNAAFDKLPAGTLDKLMQKDARTELTGVLTYHVLPGAILTEDIAKAVDLGKGKTTLPTMGGGTITATKDGDTIVLTDGSGTSARITESNVKRSNGVIQRIDAVLKPS